MPNRENRHRRTSMVLLAVVVFICMTSGHLICASTYISHIEPPKGPVYADISTDVLVVPMDVLGLLWDFWSLHSHTQPSNSRSVFGHTHILGNCFHVNNTMCPLWISVNTCFLNGVGIITFGPHRMQPLWALN